MDADWDEVARMALPPPGIHAATTPVTAMAFDTSQELFWAGNEYGRVSSFYGTEFQRYTSFKAHPSGHGPVIQLLFHDKGVIALGPTGVHMAKRTGPPIWHITHEGMTDLKCMSFTSKGTNEILVAGWQDAMFVIDVMKGEITKQIPATEHYALMKRSRYICAATRTGAVHILDSMTFKVVKTWNAHQAVINDMDAQHDFIVTCGYSLRSQQNSYMLDPLVNVFDLKNMVSLPPIPFPAGAAYVRMHPRMSTTCIIVSQIGQMHLVDLMNVNTSNVRQANVLSYLTIFEMAPSGEAMALADADFNIHLWGSPTRCRFAELSMNPEFADHEETHPQLDWETSPLNSIGLPYYREVLLSAWPSNMVSEVGAPPIKLDPQVLATMKNTEWGGYGRNPRTTRRNQAINTRKEGKSSAAIKTPKFLSEKAREASSNGISTERRVSDVADALGVAELQSLKAEVPAMYRNVEIKYSKFGVDDFDFGFYNKTTYSGLEIHISNSYANPLLQVMHFTPLIRNAALQHAASSCISDSCMLCELGFLFDMLEKAEGSICQATNLLKTLSNHPQAGALGLLEEEVHGSSTPLTTMLQALNRFFLERMTQDYKSIPPHSTAFDHILATGATTTIRCMNCRSEHTRPGTTFTNDLLYTFQKPSPRGARKITFSQVLKQSIEKETTSRGWCSRCQRYQSLATRKAIHSVPSVLMLNAAIAGPESRQLWGTPGWLPDEIGIIIDQGQFFCYEGEDLKVHLQRGVHNVTVYSLVGMAADIDSGQNQKTHLVSLVNVAHSQPTAPAEPQWHLFNDFLVRPIKKEEALTFNTTWKLPSVICYQVRTANNHIDNSWKDNLDTSLLYLDHNTNPGPKTYCALDPIYEAPNKDTLVALDTEFVSIRQPEIEINSDGLRSTIRPIVYALARVSVLRGGGDAAGVPFIDDYISTREPVVDYLTSYSGIHAGDLDPRTSRHNLLPLKHVYKKLWLLLNSGVTFLGHGLKQDFRVINIYVPRSQVIDTIEYFFIKERLRKLSLKFLAWCCLGEEIQTGMHDSIEDARTALRLWRCWEERTGGKDVEGEEVEEWLEGIYRKGREVGFKPPNAHGLPGQGGSRGLEDSRVGTPAPQGAETGTSTPALGTPAKSGGGMLGIGGFGGSPLR